VKLDDVKCGAVGSILDFSPFMAWLKEAEMGLKSLAFPFDFDPSSKNHHRLQETRINFEKRKH